MEKRVHFNVSRSNPVLQGEDAGGSGASGGSEVQALTQGRCERRHARWVCRLALTADSSLPQTLETEALSSGVGWKKQ